MGHTLKETLIVGREFSNWLHQVLAMESFRADFKWRNSDLFGVIHPFEDGTHLRVMLKTNEKEAWVEVTWCDATGTLLHREPPLQQLIGRYEYELKDVHYCFDLQSK